ncbi:MAG TPA: tRNA (adenosine(37)-N6)-threonylcarbamoyltransferase complex ATPase subunit type 1 TsaE [Acidimicrobiales bacterium]|nr:tRNA (adenosine(37)-N6)-threonylcarbamoyltransferase complex ATPase subunit type 1 TsaE [Acidimicrobiales bacterium]
MLARTTSPAETGALATALADLLRPGDLLLLSGEMGAGKTAFTQGLGAGLGVPTRITSPTFTIAQTYEGGRLLVHHLDAYRLEHLHEALDLGLAEMIDDGGVVVIEWGDALLPVLPASYLEIRITFAPLAPGSDAGPAGDHPGDEPRCWHLRPVGAAWSARSDGLRAVLAPWEAEAC